jgi:hypothetical protein
MHPAHAKMENPLDKKRRTNSAGSSWEGSGALSAATTATTDPKDKDEIQPWGMPQDQYKALNPRDKKQVRNRIGARRFRAKRKGEFDIATSSRSRRWSSRSSSPFLFFLPLF